MLDILKPLQQISPSQLSQGSWIARHIIKKQDGRFVLKKKKLVSIRMSKHREVTNHDAILEYNL